MNASKILGALAVAAALVAAPLTAASATPPPNDCVPQDAWTETISHPAVGEPTIVDDNPDYVPGTDAIWAVFSPNKDQGPFEGPPTWPTDDRGTWQLKDHIPGGHEGEDGGYQKGNGHGDWFYRQAAVPAQGEATIEVKNPDYVAPHDEVIEHPPVVCEPDEPVVVNACDAYGNGPVSTNENGLWSNVDTRSAGHYEYVPGGLHIWTDDNSSQAKVSLGYPAAFPLHNTGVLDIQYEGTGIVPGINLFVDFDNDGTQDGILVYEAIYGQDLWLTGSSADFVKADAPVVGGGNGSQWHGTIDQWLTKFPEAQVNGIAFALGSGVHGDGVIESITVGCLTYTFDYVEPEPEPTEEPTPTPTPTDTAQPTPTPTTAPTTTPVASRGLVDTLAETGSDDEPTWLLGVAGALVLALGGTLVGLRAVARRR